MKKGGSKTKLLLQIKDNLSKLHIFSRKVRKYNRFFVLSALAFAVLLSGATLLNYFNENSINKLAKANNLPTLKLDSYDDSNCFLNNGKVKCWGEETLGQLGYGATSNFSFFDYVNDLSKVGFLNLGGDATDISVGRGHSCALLSSGEVSCWGDNSLGQLGYGSTYNIGDSEVPGSVSPVALGQKAIKVTAGGSHSCALLTTGNIKCWGDNSFGQLGYGNISNIGDDESLNTVSEINLGEPVLDVTTGENHTCALLTSGNIKCWGDNSKGQLGYGNLDNIGDNETLNSAGTVNIGETVKKVVVSASNTCVILVSDNLKCWGDNTSGQLPFSDTLLGDNEIPLNIANINIGETVVDVDLGDGHTCVVLSLGKVKCWGSNWTGQLGYPGLTTIPNFNSNLEIPNLGYVDVGEQVTSMALGINHTCALLTSENIRCWGANNKGQLGKPSTVTDIGLTTTPASQINIADINSYGPISNPYTEILNDPSYNWIEASDGVQVPLDYGFADSEEVALPFNFKFFEKTYSRMFVSNSGLISFDYADTNLRPGNPAFNLSVLEDDNSNNIIAPLWSRLTEFGFSDATVHTKVVGTSPNQSMVVQWTNFRAKYNSSQFSPTPILTFQVILRSNGEIEFQYKEFDGTDFGSGSSVIARIGLKNYSGTVGNFVNTSNGKFTREISNYKISYKLEDLKYNDISYINCWPSVPRITSTLDCEVGLVKDISAVQTSNSGLKGTISLRLGINGTPITCPVSGIDNKFRCNGLLSPVSSLESIDLYYSTSGSIGGFIDAKNVATIVTNTDPEFGPVTGGTAVGIEGLGIRETAKPVSISSGWDGACTLFDNDKVKCWGSTGNMTSGYEIGDYIGDNNSPSAVGFLDTPDDVRQINTNGYKSCAVLKNGNISCWGLDLGDGFEGLGYGDYHSRNSPGPEINLGEPVTQIHNSYDSACALLQSGKVSCWGKNTGGKLGYGDLVNRRTPGPAIDLGVPATQISMDNHTCALLANGNVSCWGRNDDGQLGYGDLTNRNTPGPEISFGQPVLQVTAGEDNTCVLLTDGDISCWGDNNYGQLGYGDYNDRLVPGPSINLGAKAIEIESNTLTTCAVLENGDLKCWGTNWAGQVGDETRGGEKLSPGSRINFDTPVKEVSIGAGHVCALFINAKIKCWGDNYPGELGTPNKSPNYIFDIPNLKYIDLIRQYDISATYDNLAPQSTVIPNTKTINTVTPPHDPGFVDVRVRNGDGSLINLVQGYEYRSLAGPIPPIANNDTITTIESSPVTIDVLANDSNAVSICTGSVLGVSNGAAVISGTQIIYTPNSTYTGTDSFTYKACNTAGESNAATVDITVNPRPTATIDPIVGPTDGNTFVTATITGIGTNTSTITPQIATNGANTCMVSAKGRLRCWGYGGFGQNGYGNTNDIGTTELPITAGDVNVGGTVKQVAVGIYHTCALLTTGNVRCWGKNNNGQLGYGNTTQIGDNELPFTAGDVNVGGTVTQISAGGEFTCALLTTGNVRCWGINNYGQLGYGNTTQIGDDEFPFTAGDVNVGGTVTQISAGDAHVCALLDTGNVRCWGYNYLQYGTISLGALGYGNTNNIGDDELPFTAGDVNIGGTVTQISSPGAGNCALLTTGNVRCWGGNYYGQLGYGNNDNIGDNELPFTAGDVNVGGTVIQVSKGESHTCVLLDTAEVKCWGDSFTGQLGYGNYTRIGDNELPSSVGVVNVGGPVSQIAVSSAHTCVILTNGNVRCWGAGGNIGYGNGNAIGDNELPFTAGDVSVFDASSSNSNPPTITTPSMTFDGLQATSVVQVDPSTITAYTPAHPAGPVDVVINDSYGNTFTLVQGYTYEEEVLQPEANPDSITTPESTPVTIDILANDTNTTNICVGSITLLPGSVNNATATIVPAGTDGSLVDKVLFTPTVGYFGTVSFTYTACSTEIGTNPSSPVSVVVNVTAVNPVALNDTATVNQNEFVTINIIANDTDPSGQTLTICSPLSTLSNGNIVKTIISGTEQLVFTPNPTFSGSTSFTYTACDPAGNPSNVATVNVTVNPNTAPVANPDTANTVSNSPIAINLPANDTDTDGSLDLTSVTVVTTPTKGNVVINPVTGIGIYTATTASFTTNQADTFSYTIKDNDGTVSNAAIVTVNVIVNPIANPDIASTLSANPVTIDVKNNDTATSAALDPASVVIVTTPTKGTVTVNTTLGSPDLGKVTYTPDPAQFTTSSTDTFSYTIKDTENHISNIALATVNVTVPPANQLPLANNDTASGGKNSAITIDILSNDSDPDGTINPASVVILTNPTKGTVTVDTTPSSPNFGKAIYTPSPALYTTTSTDTFTYTVKDNNNGTSNTATVTLNIILLLPTAVNDTATLNINTPTTIQVLGNDTLATSICTDSVFSIPSGGTTTPTASQSTAGGSVVITNTAIVYTPANNFTGTDSFTYKACNADGQSNVAIVSITVNPIAVVVPVIQNVQLTLYKEKQDVDILLNQPLKIQADIRNPNNFVVQKIETTINIDTTKLNFITGTAREGSIVGNKYLSFLELNSLVSLFSITANAQTLPTATTVSFIVLSDSQLKVTILNAQPNQTIPIVFDVTPKANLQNSIQGTTSIIDTTTNLAVASANAEIKITPAPTLLTLVRTGGYALPAIIISLGTIAVLFFVTRKRKLNVKISNDQ